MLILSLPLGILPIIVTLVLIVSNFLIAYNRKTPYGKAEAIKWEKLRRNMVHGNVKTVNEIYPMDIYLVYSIILGVDENIIDDFIESIKDSYLYLKDSNYLWYGVFMISRNNFLYTMRNSFVSPSLGRGFARSSGGAGGGGASGF